MEVAERLAIILQQERSVEKRREIVGFLNSQKPFLEDKMENNLFYRNLHVILFIINENNFLLSKDDRFLDEMEEVAIKGLEFNDRISDFYYLMGTAKILRGENEEGELFFKEGLKIRPEEKDKAKLLLESAYLKARSK